MALSAAGITRVGNAGDIATRPAFIESLSFLGDNSYPTGGYAFDAVVEEKLGVGLEIIAAHGIGQGAAGYHVLYVKSTGKLMVLVGATALELAGATDLSAVTFTVTVFAK